MEYVEYKNIRPQMIEYTKRWESLVKQVLDANYINYESIQSRTKTLSSYLLNQLKQVKDNSKVDNDLIGLRIITYSNFEKNLIIKLFESEFEILENQVKSDPNGYRGVHLLIKINKNRKDLPEYLDLISTRVEVQLHNLLEHAWAAVDHYLEYKGQYVLPPELILDIKKNSEMIKKVDKIYDDLFSNFDEHINTLKENILKADLNARGEKEHHLKGIYCSWNELTVLLRHSDLYSNWNQLLDEIPELISYNFAYEDNNVDIYLLKKLCDIAEIRMLQQFIDILSNSKDKILEILKEIKKLHLPIKLQISGYGILSYPIIIGKCLTINDNDKNDLLNRIAGEIKLYAYFVQCTKKYFGLV